MANKHLLITIISTSLLYTLLVFGAGFVCGIIRVIFLEPRLDDRYAQLLEMPLMMAVIWRSARIVVSRIKTQTRATGDSEEGKGKYIAVGALALFFFLVTEGGLYALIHRGEGKGWHDWVWDRDPVAGSLFFAMLGVMMALPTILS
ncbi:hypothetical protein B0H63DRAFT_474818 [Podospora didyma]|uniref:Uncharacterized protein n=1 Tax=Podospora didyma TaxID=330526 RepID=A0AAE0TVM9_9PEZI|nr:hypothetical protein B0H63DRAFT_474818 [Podospora didyma]